MNKTLLEIYHILLDNYHFQFWWPSKTSFEIIIGAILTQNVSWKNVEKALNNLRDKGILEPEKLLKIPCNELAEYIKSTGFYKQKAKKIFNFLEFFRRYDFSLERLKQKSIKDIRAELLNIKGIGKETADSIILYALYKPIFVVDAYTRRMFSRIGILDREDMKYDNVREIFEDSLPRDVILFQDYHAQIVVHSKEVCRKKPLCDMCILRSFCKFGIEVAIPKETSNLL
jgi:endonuclease-3 related protein